eukprot:scaffold2867_cov188-Prasinococcus_capsulatus_cf.AAC.1
MTRQVQVDRRRTKTWTRIIAVGDAVAGFIHPPPPPPLAHAPARRRLPRIYMTWEWGVRQRTALLLAQTPRRWDAAPARRPPEMSACPPRTTRGASARSRSAWRAAVQPIKQRKPIPFHPIPSQPVQSVPPSGRAPVLASFLSGARPEGQGVSISISSSSSSCARGRRLHGRAIASTAPPASASAMMRAPMPR